MKGKLLIFFFCFNVTVDTAPKSHFENHREKNSHSNRVLETVPKIRGFKFVRNIYTTERILLCVFDIDVPTEIASYRSSKDPNFFPK